MLYDKLKKYWQSGIYPFHMPGHKRNIHDEYIPYDIDLTEVYGLDNLHSANGCIKEIADKAAKLYSVNSAYLLINGATGGILAAIRTLTNYGDKVLVARNCHKSVYNAIELCGLDTKYIIPEINEGFGIFSSINPDNVDKMLDDNPEIKLVIITSPTYEGVVSDIKSISTVCSRHNAMLFVDEAHGAHFPYSGYFPDEAVKCGADAAVTSLHKTLPSLTQTALLLTDNMQFKGKIEENLSVFETSSPSYILMSSIEKCLDFLEKSDTEFINYTNRLDNFIESCKKLKHLKLLNKQSDFYKFDRSKIVISTSKTNINGVMLAKILRENYNIETEMSYTNYIIAMTSVCDSSEGFQRLIDALSEIDNKLSSNDHNFKYNYISSIPEKIFKSSEKTLYNSKKVLLSNSENCVSLEYIWAYPPGIPIVVPGERITKEIINHINFLTAYGVEIFSSSESSPDYINVAQID